MPRCFATEANLKAFCFTFCLGKLPLNNPQQSSLANIFTAQCMVKSCFLFIIQLEKATQIHSIDIGR